MSRIPLRLAGLVTAFLVLASIACNLTSQTSMTAPTRTPVNTAVAQDGINAPTLISLATNISTLVPTLAVPCTMRTDWPVYTVVSGDTLASIAVRTSSSISELVAGNCLANADRITAGQQLHVPVVPQPAPTSTGCTVRSDWPEYTVWKGDTLEFLAGFGQVTIQDLIKGNCWIDANDFFAGRTMRVPNIPGRDGSPVSVCKAIEPGGVGQIWAEPSDFISTTCLHIRAASTVKLTWFNAPPDLKEVEFWFVPEPDPAQQFSGDPDVIGVDENPADGVSINWQVYNASVSGVVYAYGFPNVGKAITSGATALTTW